MCILTGTLDDYKTSCEYAYKYFSELGYETQIKILDGIDHEYISTEEEFILDFLTGK